MKLHYLLLILSLLIVAPSCSSKKKTSKSKTTTTKTTTKSTSTTSKSSSSSKNSSTTTTKSSSLTTACNKLGVSADDVTTANLYIVSASWLGSPYKYGGQTKSGTDCSGMTGAIYKEVYGKSLYRSSADIYANDIKKINKSNLQEGDLVFFRTDGKNSSTPNHVGIYLKEDKFIHASTKAGVVVSSMSQSYYVQNYIGAGRVTK